MVLISPIFQKVSPHVLQMKSSGNTRLEQNSRIWNLTTTLNVLTPSRFTVMTSASLNKKGNIHHSDHIITPHNMCYQCLTRYLDCMKQISLISIRACSNNLIKQQTTCMKSLITEDLNARQLLTRAKMAETGDDVRFEW